MQKNNSTNVMCTRESDRLNLLAVIMENSMAYVHHCDHFSIVQVGIFIHYLSTCVLCLALSLYEYQACTKLYTTTAQSLFKSRVISCYDQPSSIEKSKYRVQKKSLLSCTVRTA